MKTHQIYTEYNIPPNLQEHMYRVASLAKIITENWMGEKIDKEVLIKSCLLHDMGNLIKFTFDPSQDKLLGSEYEDVDYWKKEQKKMVAKYGLDEHDATLEICKELNVDEQVLYVVRNKEFRNMKKITSSTNWELRLCRYCDSRIAPTGILSLEGRFDDVIERYKNKPGSLVSTNLRKAKYTFKLEFENEEEIQTQTKINLEEITDDDDLEKNFEVLRKYEI